MAFGTGHHETTRSCLVLMEKYADKTGKDTFLDLGTGTGLLAIAAAKLGYRHVLGIDIDPLAVEAQNKTSRSTMSRK
jgi:ribosomal protein L11 methyltransferase